MDPHFGLGQLEQVRQTAKMVDMSVRDQDSADIGDLERLVELVADRFQSVEDLLIAVSVAAACIDQRQRPASNIK